MTEYLRVRPTTEPLDPNPLPRVLESLHKLTSSEPDGLATKLNPFRRCSPPCFEFLALSTGPDAPVEFYYGADEHLETLQQRLRSIYPETFDVEQVQLDVESRLIQPVEYTPSEFADEYEAGQLQYEFGPDERHDPDEAESGVGGATDGEPVGNDGPATVGCPEHYVHVGETVLELAPPDVAPSKEEYSRLEKPTLTADGTILARPTVDTVSPLGVRWCGDAERKRDWMTTLTPVTTEDETALEGVEQPGGALASLVEHLMTTSAPTAFQVVFQRHADWQADAALRTDDLRRGRDTLVQRTIGAFIEPTTEREEQDERELGEAVERRIEAIKAKNAKRSFTVNVRAVTVPTANTQDALDARMDALAPVFDPIDGQFYAINGKRLREKGFRETTKLKHARATLQRVLNRELTTGRGTTRPDLILDGAELANLIVVPDSERLSMEGSRGTRTERQSRTPLPTPNPDLLGQFQEGMAIGYALDEHGESRPDPVRLPPKLLTTHYGRFGSTGSGKSKAGINDALSLRETTGGPVVLVDPKGDGMCENYMRCHYEQFGRLDDVYQFRVPETLPAFSFFDIRPALAAGRNREDAIQDKVDHFHDILRMIMGREQYGQAFVANEILTYLIKALFDTEYGSDAFGLDDLFDAAQRMQRDEITPPVSAGNKPIHDSLTRHFEKDTRQFQTSMDAVGNRLDKLKEDAHLRRIFSHVPEQNDAGEYVDNRFDFREFLDEDATILFDLGDLRPEAQRAITLLLLSNLWDAVQVRRRDGQTNYRKLTNLIIEEAAPIASTKLVSEQLLPQGRSFGLSMGLVMQFPGQVRNRNERAYHEVLNNIKTKLIGNISIERDLAESLAHEDLSPTELRNRINTLPSGEWIAQLPSPSFGETGPAPFSLKPLPIPPGHPESDQPLTEPQEDHFESVSRPRMVERTQAQYGLTVRTESSSAPAETGWGSSEAETTSSTTDGDTASDPTQSAFISESTTADASMSTPQTETDSDHTGEEAEMRSLFGQATETDEEPAADQATQPENESTLIQESSVSVPDDELRQRGLNRDDVRFLSRVLGVMNRDDDKYTLLHSMRALRDEFEDLNFQRLIDQNLVEEASACGRKYYTVLPAGRELLGEKLQVGPGLGDIGEKTPHKVGVRLLELWIQQQDDVVRVDPYYEHDDDTVFDVAGFDANDELVWVGEAELPSNNTHAPVDDYDKLRLVDADAIWAFNNRDTAVEILDTLADADRIEESVSGRDARSFSTIRTAVADFDAGGMSTVRGFKNLDQEVNQ